jgi:hypothetical protein
MTKIYVGNARQAPAAAHPQRREAVIRASSIFTTSTQAIDGPASVLPEPAGELHVGNLLNAVLTSILARQLGTPHTLHNPGAVSASKLLRTLSSSLRSPSEFEDTPAEGS